MNIKLRNKIILLCTVLLSSFFLVACETEPEPVTDAIENYNSGINNIIDESVYTVKVPNTLTDDKEDNVDHALNDFKPENTAIVILDDENTVINNAVDETIIYMQDGNLVVDSTKKLTLILKGTLNGSVTVNKSDGKLKMILDGVDITSSSGPAINIQSEKRSFLVLQDGSVNNLIDGTEHPTLSNGSNTNAAFFSEEQIIISGTGELNINGRYKHGIVSDDYIKIISGTVNILSATADGLHANDYIVIDGGTININANSNGMECERGYIAINGGSVTIEAINDGIKTSYHDGDTTIYPFIHILNGMLDISAQKEGITATSDINIYGGNLIILSVDDAVSSDGAIYLDGGVHSLHSIEKQSLDGDISVEINGGISVLLVDGDSASIESDDGYIAILGGTVIAGGPIDIDISDSTQGYIKYGSVMENEILNVKSDTSLLTVAFIADYTHVVLSTPTMEIGDTLDVYHNGSIVGNNFYGIYTSGVYSNGTLDNSYTVE